MSAMSPLDAVSALERLRGLGFDEFATIPDHVRGVRLSAENVHSVMREALACLAVINRTANGEVPSQVVGRQNPSALSDAAYPVAELICGGLLRLSRLRREAMTSDNSKLSDALIEATTTLAYAWTQVLAGDMDNICDGLKESLF